MSLFSYDPFWTNPFAEMASLQRTMNRIFDDALSRSDVRQVEGGAIQDQGQGQGQGLLPDTGEQAQTALATVGDRGLQLAQPGFGAALWRPRVDVSENDQAICIHAELPGLSKDQVNIDVQNNVLTLSGETKQEKKEDKERFHRVERRYGKFVRSFFLPDGVDPSDITANFKDGVLEVNVPKPKELQAKLKGHKVPVQ